MPEVERPFEARVSGQDASTDEPKDRHAEYFIRAVGNAIDILALISASPEPVSLVKITELIGQSKSSVFRILCTLEKKGLLERRPGDLFALSPNGLCFRSNRTLNRLNQAAYPHIRDLGREFRETVSLCYVFENHIEIVHVMDSPQRIRMFNVLGGIIPPHAEFARQMHRRPPAGDGPGAPFDGVWPAFVHPSHHHRRGAVRPGVVPGSRTGLRDRSGRKHDWRMLFRSPDLDLARPGRRRAQPIVAERPRDL